MTRRLKSLQDLLSDLSNQCSNLGTEYEPLILDGKEIEALDVWYHILDLFDAGLSVPKPRSDV